MKFSHVHVFYPHDENADHVGCEVRFVPSDNPGYTFQVVVRNARGMFIDHTIHHTPTAEVAAFFWEKWAS